MNSKKVITAIIAIVVVGVIAMVFWRGGTSQSGVKIAPAGGELTGETSQQGAGMGQVSEQPAGQTAGGSIGAMTDDIYVELIVQAAYLAQKSPSTYVSTMQNLYSKYGVTSENVTAYGEALGKDPARAQAVAEKYTQQIMKMQQAAQ